MSRGLNLNNPFDLEVSEEFTWEGEIRPTTDCFKVLCQFDSMADGVRAGIKDLYNQQHLHGLTTWTEIITKYAPPGENDTASYIKAMSIETGVGADDPIDLSMPSFLAKSAKAVMMQEQGCNPCTDNQIAMAVYDVLGITSTIGA